MLMMKCNNKKTTYVLFWQILFAKKTCNRMFCFYITDTYEEYHTVQTVLLQFVTNSQTNTAEIEHYKNLAELDICQISSRRIVT